MNAFDDIFKRGTIDRHGKTPKQVDEEEYLENRHAAEKSCPRQLLQVLHLPPSEITQPRDALLAIS